MPTGKSKYYVTDVLRERLLADDTERDIVFETVEEILARAKPENGIWR
jgi:hypothetical protein